jgi:hypothetical protein
VQTWEHHLRNEVFANGVVNSVTLCRDNNSETLQYLD